MQLQIAKLLFPPGEKNEELCRLATRFWNSTYDARSLQSSLLSDELLCRINHLVTHLHSAHFTISG